MSSRWSEAEQRRAMLYTYRRTVGVRRFWRIRWHALFIFLSIGLASLWLSWWR